MHACMQQRYEAFLQGNRARGRRQSMIEHEAETREFEQARRLYKPLSKIMALRFQPASSAATGDQGSLAEQIKQEEEKQAQEEDAQAAVREVETDGGARRLKKEDWD